MASESDLPDNDDIKKKALARLAIAGLVTASALGGLWWLDQGKKPEGSKVARSPEPAPIRPAQLPEPEPPQALKPEEPPLEAGSQEMPADSNAPMEAPPPPRVSNTPRTFIPAQEPEVRQTTTSPTGQPEPVAPAAPTGTQSTPALPPMAHSGSFVVQLGVFTSPARAEELVRQLKAKGIRASTETRVNLGPFLNRQEADKAQSEMQRLGFEGVVTTVAPRK